MGLMRPADMDAEDSMKEAERRVIRGLRSESGLDDGWALVAEADLAPTLQGHIMWRVTLATKGANLWEVEVQTASIPHNLCTQASGSRQGAALGQA